MTHRVRLTLAMMLVVGPISSAFAQRARVPDGNSASTGRTAVERQAAPPSTTPAPVSARAPERPSDAVRVARDRPAAPVQAVPALASSGASSPASISDADPSRRHDRGDDDRNRGDAGRDRNRNDRDSGRGNGGVTINSIVINPVRVGPNQLGTRTTIGKSTVIGGRGEEPERQNRRRSTRPSAVYFGPFGASSYYVTESAGEPGSVTAISARDRSIPDEPDRDAYVRESAGHTPALASLGSYYSFATWYSVTDRIAAGYPVAYPERYAATYQSVGISDLSLLATPDRLPLVARLALESGVPLILYENGTFGGISFQVEPIAAAVYVDGLFVGLLEDYPADGPPLPLPVGVHEIELRAPAFRGERFEVLVTKGMVTPLAGVMLRVAP